VRCVRCPDGPRRQIMIIPDTEKLMVMLLGRGPSSEARNMHVGVSMKANFCTRVDFRSPSWGAFVLYLAPGIDPMLHTATRGQ
jgi:hypothetical protein